MKPITAVNSLCICISITGIAFTVHTHYFYKNSLELDFLEEFFCNWILEDSENDMKMIKEASNKRINNAMFVHEV